MNKWGWQIPKHFWVWITDLGGCRLWIQRELFISGTWILKINKPNSLARKQQKIQDKAC